MFCTSCGSSTAGLTFCSNCGTAVAQAAAATQAPAQYAQAAPVANPAYQNAGYANQGYAAPSGYVQGSAGMSFGDAVSKFFKDYANFKGRSRRSEYWYQYLFMTLVLMGTSVLSALDMGLTYGIAALAFLIPSLSTISRRLHDTGKSFGYFFFVLIPIVGWILLIVWLATDSNRGPNQYGNSVKY
jgi:uncharacterized membrane protein YhaH (DUF805 family)